MNAAKPTIHGNDPRGISDTARQTETEYPESNLHGFDPLQTVQHPIVFLQLQASQYRNRTPNWPIVGDVVGRNPETGPKNHPISNHAE